MVRARTSAVVVFACAAVAASGCGSGNPPRTGPSPAETARELRGLPPVLAALHEQAGHLVNAAPRAFRFRLLQLRGHPVVINKWASWCAPCRQEFPYFQRLGASLGKRVAFIGVDGNDNDGDAESFLRRYPVPYPSYRDPEGEIARVFEGNLAFPTTAFYDARGRLTFVHQGQYPSEAKLRSDIRRYAGI
jgi:cytochrome c biogenesis protein CcmG, thiol:disulfide interchange protein DsbE